MKNTARAYQRLAPRYDARWGRYLAETLGRAAGLVEGLPAGLVAGQGRFRILDVGCGTGELYRHLRARFPEAAFVGMDPAAGMLAQARVKFPSAASRAAFLRAAAEAIPFRDGQFDWVVSCNGLHCFQDAGIGIREMARVARKGGRVLVMDWARESWLAEIFNRWCCRFDPSHVWMHSENEVSRMMESAGLSVKRAERFRVSWPGPLRLWEMMAVFAVKPDSG